MLKRESGLAFQKNQLSSHSYYPKPQKRINESTLAFLKKENEIETYAKRFRDLLGSTELDLYTLIHSNVGYFKTATNSQNCHVFLVDGDEIYFSSPESRDWKGRRWKIEEESSNIAARVAQHKEFFVTNEVTEQNSGGEKIPQSLLYIPLVTPGDVLLGVVELQRFSPNEPYNIDDVKAMIALVGWLSTTVHLKWEHMRLDKELILREQCLDFAIRCMNPQADMNRLTTEITNFIKTRIGVEKCIFYKFDSIGEETVAFVFEESLFSNKCSIVDNMYMKNVPFRLTEDQGFLSFAFVSNEIMNIKDIYDPRFNKEKDEYRSNVHVRNALVVPIWSSKTPRGAMMLLNKTGLYGFTENDEEFFRKIKPYLSVSLQHDFYREFCRIRNLEIKHYMGIARCQIMPCIHTETFHCIPPSELEPLLLNIQNPLWSPALVQTDYVNHLVYYMVMEIIQDNQYEINNNEVKTMIQWLHNAYRNNPYHNVQHAFTVCHSIYVVLKNNEDTFSHIERSAMVIAALFHDVDHPGLNNNFYYLTGHPHVALYENSFVENHHCLVALSFLGSNTIFEHMDRDVYKRFISEVQSAIMATDMEQYFHSRNNLLHLYESNHFDMNNFVHRFFLKGVVMIYADFSEFIKNFEIASDSTNKLYKEWYLQGDKEKSLGYNPISIMDRTIQPSIVKDQIHFLDVFLIPCIQLLSLFLPNMTIIHERSIRVKKKWLKILKGNDVTDNFSHIQDKTLTQDILP